MWKKILIAVVVLLVLFLGYVSTRPAQFNYERSGLIQATPDKIYPYISQFKLGTQWSPYEKGDPEMKREYVGEDGTVGAAEIFDGKNSGTGRLEILRLIPNESVQLRLTMTKPFTANHIVDYILKPEGGGTRFIWVMSGENGFMGKLIGVLIDCEKMIGGQFEEGIANLKQVVESQK